MCKEDVLSEVEHIPVSLAVNNVILDSEHGPEIAYELAKNPKEYERINKLPPLAAARELGKIEARISQASSEKKKPETNKITQAPKPMNPLKGGKRAPVKSLYDADRMSQAEYEALRRAKPKK